MHAETLADAVLRVLGPRCGVIGARMAVLWPDGRTQELFSRAGAGTADRALEAQIPGGGIATLWVWLGDRVGADEALLSEIFALVLASPGLAPPPPASDPVIRLAEERSEDEVLFRAIFQSTSDAIAISLDGVHRMVNPAYLALFGHDDPTNLVDKPILDLIAPESHDIVRDYTRRRTLGLDVPTAYEIRGRRRDGTPFDMEVRVSLYGFQGRTYSLALLRDITRQKQAEAALRESRAFYRALFDVNTAVKLLIDPEDGTIVDANHAACAFYGWSLDELKGMRITQINLASPEEVYRELERARTARRKFFHFRHRLANGDIRHMEIHSGPIEFGGRTLLLSILHDITARKQLEEQLRQAQKMEAVGRLAGGIAHDFNNLLTVIVGHADLVLERADFESPVREDVEHLMRAALRGEDLVRQLLAFSRRQVLQPRRVRLAEVVERVQHLIQRLIGTHIRFELALASSEGWVEADPVQIEQVILNLAANARDAMPRGGRLGVIVKDEQIAGDRAPAGVVPGDYVTLIVTDEGVGMDERTLAHAFEPFFTTKSDRGGTGLGLATVYGIVKQSGGHLTLDTEPGRGTTFTIRLPRVEPTAPEPQPETVRRPTPIGRTVLVVEDQPDVRNFLVHRLRLSGYTVLEAADGDEAIALSDSAERLDLLITDVIMPGMSGPELHAALERRRPGLEAIFASGYPEGLPDTSKVRFLQKPFSGRTLLAAVAEALAIGS